MRAPSSSSSLAWASQRAPSADGADVRGGATRPFFTPPRTEFRRAFFEVAGSHLFLHWWFRTQGTGARFSLALLAPLPNEEWGGRSWACQGESAPGFPAHFNSVSASTARRFTGRARALRRNSFCLPHIAFPQEWKSGARSAFLEPLRAGGHFLPFRSSNSNSHWQLKFSNNVALRDYLMSPCARWCGRAVSSSWKLPPRGARRARPGGGERRGRTRPLSQGKAPRPLPLPVGREGRHERGRGENRARKRGERFPAPPPGWITTGFHCCPLLPTAPRAPIRPREGLPGLRSRWGRGNQSRDLWEWRGFLSENLKLL